MEEAGGACGPCRGSCLLATHLGWSMLGRGGCGGTPAKQMSDTSKLPLGSTCPFTAATMPAHSHEAKPSIMLKHVS